MIAKELVLGDQLNRKSFVQRRDIRCSGIQHNGTQRSGLNCDNRHAYCRVFVGLTDVMLIVVRPSVIMLIVISLADNYNIDPKLIFHIVSI